MPGDGETAETLDTVYRRVLRLAGLNGPWDDVGLLALAWLCDEVERSRDETVMGVDVESRTRAATDVLLGVPCAHANTRRVFVPGGVEVCDACGAALNLPEGL